MATHQAFNGVMEEFLNELIKTFPEEKSLKVQYNQYLALKKANHKKIVDGFMTHIGQYTDRITNKDETLFDEDIEFLRKINIKKWWTDQLSTSTKDAIWQYLSTLIMLGTTITALPDNILQSIEGVAEQCASQMGEGGGMPNLGALFQNVQAMLGNMEDKKIE